jgi:glycine hydroxymethyltransferase
LRIVSGGTDNHLMLVDVWMGGKGITGKVAEKALEAANITVNKNTIPFDQNKPFVASGLRIGTPAVTTRGMKEPEMREIGRLIAAIVREPESDEVQRQTKQGVADLTAKFPLYAKRLKQTASGGAEA